MHTWARSDPEGEVNERGGREGIYICGVGRRVFSPKRRKMGSVNSVFMLFTITIFFREGVWLSVQGGGESFPLKALGGVTTPYSLHTHLCYASSKKDMINIWVITERFSRTTSTDAGIINGGGPFGNLRFEVIKHFAAIINYVRRKN